MGQCAAQDKLVCTFSRFLRISAERMTLRPMDTDIYLCSFTLHGWSFVVPVYSKYNIKRANIYMYWQIQKHKAVSSDFDKPKLEAKHLLLSSSVD